MKKDILSYALALGTNFCVTFLLQKACLEETDTFHKKAFNFVYKF